MQRQTSHGRQIGDLGQLRRQPLRRLLLRHLGLWRPLHPLPSSGLMGRRKVLFTFTASVNNIFSHCIFAEDNNSYHNWDAGLQFLGDKEISGNLFALRDFNFTSALPLCKERTKFSNCVKKVLVLADIFQDSIRARDTLRHLARSLPTLLLSDGFKTIQTRCNRLLKGDLEWLWASCTKQGRSR